MIKKHKYGGAESMDRKLHKNGKWITEEIIADTHYKHGIIRRIRKFLNEARAKEKVIESIIRREDGKPNEK